MSEEVKEVVNEVKDEVQEEAEEEPKVEEPNEADVERIFAAFRKSMETLQTLLQAEVERFQEDGVECKDLSLEIEPMELTVTVGKWVLWHQVSHHTYKRS